MKVQSFDSEQEGANPYHGTSVYTAADLESVLEDARHRGRKPLIVKLEGDNGFELGIGIGDPGFVQHERSNGDTPSMIAVRPGAPTDENINYADDEKLGPVPEFLCGGTPSPIPWRFALPFDLVKRIAIEFLETGERSTAVEWYG
jgi:hypothetical protein